MIRLLTLLCLTYIACTPAGEKDPSENASLSTASLPELSDSVSIKDLNKDQLVAYVDKLVRTTQANLATYDTLSITYDCPNILDKGRLKVYKKDRDIQYIYHEFQNGRHKSSVHQYYLLDGEVVLADYLDGYWSFEIGSDKRGQNVTTVNKIYFDGLNEKACLDKKFIYSEEENPMEERKKHDFQDTNCSKAKVALSKFRLISSILHNPKRENKPCIFY